jgi:trk system potassium uptake protein
MQFVGSVTKYPARISFGWYIAFVIVGAAILMLPVCHVDGRMPLSWLDALFTATSATCVTGLTVRSTAGDFSFFGQIVILILIQLGGIGIMTVTTFVTFVWGRHQGLRERAVVSETLGASTNTDLRWVLRNVIGMTFIIETAGFVVMAVRNSFQEPLATAVWHALFHSVSAFCNAGFALFDDSLTQYQTDPVVNLTICGLIISGGLGFPVMFDLQRNWSGPWDERWRRLHLHSKLMLVGTAGLLVFGTFSLLILEWRTSLADMSLPQRLLVAFFQSVTTRTAGFNTVNIASLTNASLFLVILLMLIGAGPCSTGGGFKVSTFVALLARAHATLKGHGHTNLFRRTLANKAIHRAVVTVLIFTTVLIVGLTSLLVVEQSRLPHDESQGLFLDAAFETASALGTVGLSTGMTPRLSSPGRVIIILLMFIGRLGPISIFVAVSRSERSQPLELPEEEPLIG